MPYASKAQRGYMHEHHPEIAARWDREYPNQGNLPARKRQTKATGPGKVKARRVAHS